MDLQRFVGDARQHLAGVQLGRGDFAIGAGPLVQPPSRRQRQPVGGVDLGDHVRQLERHALKLADGLAELPTFGGVAKRQIERPARSTDAHGGHRQARSVQPLVGEIETAMRFAENLLGTQPAILERKNAVAVAAVGDGIVAAANLEARRAAIHQETGDALLRPAGGLLFASGHEDDHEIRRCRRAK